MVWLHIYAHLITLLRMITDTSIVLFVFYYTKCCKLVFFVVSFFLSISSYITSSLLGRLFYHFSFISTEPCECDSVLTCSSLGFQKAAPALWDLSTTQAPCCLCAPPGTATGSLSWRTSTTCSQLLWLAASSKPPCTQSCKAQVLGFLCLSWWIFRPAISNINPNLGIQKYDGNDDGIGIIPPDLTLVGRLFYIIFLGFAYKKDELR